MENSKCPNCRNNFLRDGICGHCGYSEFPTLRNPPPDKIPLAQVAKLTSLRVMLEEAKELGFTIYACTKGEQIEPVELTNEKIDTLVKNYPNIEIKIYS